MIARNTDKQTDTRAATPVIGIVLIVAVTIILAASVSVFALSVEPQEPAPTTALELSVKETGGTDAILIQHRGGESLQPENLRIKANAKNGGSATYEESVFDNIETLQAGESESVAINQEGEIEVTVIHEPSGSILAEETFQGIESDAEAFV